MNERIKKLLLKAGFTNTYTDPQDGFELVFVDEDHTTQSVEKFAELIIRECIEVARQQRNPQNLNYKPSERFVEDLQQHFGVK